jgi:TonB family protein
MKSLSVVLMLWLAGTPNPVGQSAPELQASGKWTMEYAQSSCIISRVFGEGTERTIVAFKPAPYSENVQIVLIKPGAGRVDRGDASVTFSSGYVPAYAYYSTTAVKGARVTLIDVPRAALDALAKGDTISIAAAKWIRLSIHPAGFDKVITALSDCESDLLSSWGFGKVAQDAVVTRPKGSLREAIKPDDYPESALDAGLGGTVGVRLRVETDGKVTDCLVVEKSGVPDLDKQTCAVAKRRALYTPAIGHDGKPLWSFTFERVTWMVVDM